MNQIIDMTRYLPQPTHTAPHAASPLRTVLLALESLVTAVIGVCTMVGIIVFFLMLF